MSLISLEKFNKQFENGDILSVSDFLKAKKSGLVDLYQPVTQRPDISLVVKKVYETLPHIAEIVRSPYIVLKTEYNLTRTERSGALTPYGIKQTVKEPKLWKQREDKSLYPEFVYAKTNEDEYNTYENRLVRTLIDRIVRLLELPTENAKSGVTNIYQEYFQSSALNKLDLIKLMDTSLFKDTSSEVFDEYKKLFYMRAKFSQLRNSDFYKIMSNCPSFSGSAEATNLFVHNKHYNACFKLWKLIDEHNAGMNSLPLTQRRSVYCAFISFAVVDSFVQMGFKLDKDVHFDNITEQFGLKNLVLSNELFTVTINSDVEELSILVQCSKLKIQQKTVLQLHSDASQPYRKDCQFIVSLFKTEYNERARCVVPSNKNSLTDIKSIVRCTVFLLQADKQVYSRMCLVCGSSAIDDKGYYFACQDCKAVYAFVDDNTIWLNQFNTLNEQQ